MKLTREQLRERAAKLISTFGKECMIEQSEEHYVPQAVREYLPGYKETDDKLYLYKGEYIIKGYNIRFLKGLSKEEREQVIKNMDAHKKFILDQKRNEDMER